MDGARECWMVVMLLLGCDVDVNCAADRLSFGDCRIHDAL